MNVFCLRLYLPRLGRFVCYLRRCPILVSEIVFVLSIPIKIVNRKAAFWSSFFQCRGSAGAIFQLVLTFCLISVRPASCMTNSI